MKAGHLWLAIAWLAALCCSASEQDVSVPGRYAHCAVAFADRMIIYGGRGFQQGASSQSLSTLGCAVTMHRPSVPERCPVSPPSCV